MVWPRKPATVELGKAAMNYMAQCRADADRYCLLQVQVDEDARGGSCAKTVEGKSNWIRASSEPPCRRRAQVEGRIRRVFMAS